MSGSILSESIPFNKGVLIMIALGLALISFASYSDTGVLSKPIFLCAFVMLALMGVELLFERDGFWRRSE